MFVQYAVTEPIYYLRVIVIIIISIVFHELAHGFAALLEGDNTPKRLGHWTLDPFVHMGAHAILLLCLIGITWGAMPVEPRKFRHRKWGRIFVASAGPIANLILCLLAVFIFQVEYGLGLMILSPEFFFMMASINLMLFFFNLIPVPPLDGYHIVKEFFPGLEVLAEPQYRRLYFLVLFMTGLPAGLAWVSRTVVFQMMPLTY